MYMLNSCYEFNVQCLRINLKFSYEESSINILSERHMRMYLYLLACEYWIPLNKMLKLRRIIFSKNSNLETERNQD